MDANALRGHYVDPDDWVIAAACRGHTDLFFPPDASETRGERREREDRAKAVCGRCDVRHHCLSEAVASDEHFGIWGGMNERERRVYVRSLERGSPAAPGRSVRFPAPQDLRGPRSG